MVYILILTFLLFFTANFCQNDNTICVIEILSVNNVESSYICCTIELSKIHILYDVGPLCQLDFFIVISHQICIILYSAKMN